MSFRIVGILVGHGDAWQLIERGTLAIFTSIGGKMEGELEVRGGKMDAGKKFISDEVESCLLLLFPEENGILPAQNIGHGLGDDRKVLDVLSGHHKESENATQLVNVRWRKQLPNRVQML